MIPSPPASQFATWRKKRLLPRDPEADPLRLFIDTRGIPSPTVALLRELVGEPGRIRVFVASSDLLEWPSGSVGVAVEKSPRDVEPVAVTSHAAGHGVHRIHGVAHCVRLADRETDSDKRSEVLGHLLMVAAGASVADIAVTAGRLATTDQTLRRDGVTSPDEAVAVIGLWQRWHRRAVMVAPRWGVMNTTNSWIHWLAVRAATPAAWRYVGSCMEAERNGKARLGELAMSVIVRLARALRARDEIHWVLWGAHQVDARDELLYHLDVFLLMLGAAFDASARSTFLIYDLGSDPIRQSWRTLLSNKKSALALQKDASALHNAVGERGAIARRRLIAALRNSIHEEPLQSISSPSIPALTVAVAPHLVDTVRNAAEAAGTPDELGLHHDASGVRIEPGPFVEAMVRSTIRDIDLQMANTDVDRLGVGGYDAPDADDMNFGVEASASVLALTGLTDVVTPDHAVRS